MARSRTHKVLVTVRTDRPITAAEARYAVWNHVHDLLIYGGPGDGWEAGKLTVSKSAPKKEGRTDG